MTRDDVGHMETPGSSALSDAMDRLGIAGTVPGILPMSTGWRVAGPAFTVRYVPVAHDVPGTVGDYIDDVPEGAVVVLDNAGRTDCTVWGGILTAVAKSRQIQGTVIDGVCRDLSSSFRLDYPLFTRGRFMRTGKDRVEAAEVGGSVVLGDIRVDPEDIVVGDDDGIVVVPAKIWSEVLESATQVEEAEARILRAVEGGSSLTEARRSVGYHELQRAQAGDT